MQARSLQALHFTHVDMGIDSLNQLIAEMIQSRWMGLQLEGGVCLITVQPLLYRD